MGKAHRARVCGSARTLGATVWFLLAAWMQPAQAAGPPARLLYAEPLAATWTQDARVRAPDPDRPAHSRMRFHAFGRAFEFDLQSNPRLDQAAGGSPAQAGTLTATPGSWARITRRGDDLIGLFSDGKELYGIEPAAGLVEFMDPAAPLPDGHNLVYRLADLQLDAGALACGLDPPEGMVSAAAAVAAISGELAVPPTAAATTGTLRQIALIPVADAEFASRYGADADSEIMARLNIVDGIFREQVGIDFDVGAPEIFRSTAEPYPFKSTTANTLLNQLSDYRVQSGQYRDFGLTHLFTEKHLDGDLAGIAWLGAACLTREGAALSSSYQLPVSMHALVAAHEIGHNFNAQHDGEAGSSCESTAKTFLMAPQISSGSTAATFSTCSVDRMRARIDRLSCLTTIASLDVALLAPSGVTGSLGQPTDIELTVQNLGAQDATNVVLTIALPAALTVASSTAAPGNCAAQADGLRCDLSLLGAGASWLVRMAVRSDAAQRYTVTARAAAANDESPANDAAQFSVTIGNPEPPASSGGSSGGGGGGALGAATLVALAIAGLRRRTRPGG